MKIKPIAQALIIMALFVYLSNDAYSQARIIRDTVQAVEETDTIYFLDGSKSNVKILEWEDAETVVFGRWDDGLNKMLTREHDKSDIHYIYFEGEYHLINDVSPDNDLARLQHNLLEYKERSRSGMVTLSLGVGLVLTGNIVAEIQQSKFEDTHDPDELSDTPKYLNYAGYGFMLIGGVIKIGSYQFLERGSIDITPVGLQ